MKYIRMLLAVVGLFVAGGAKGAALADDNNPARAFPPGPVIGIYVPFRGSVFNSTLEKMLRWQANYTLQSRRRRRLHSLEHLSLR